MGNKCRYHGAGGKTCKRQQHTGADGHPACSERTLLLAVVPTVLLQVEEIVQNIGSGSTKAKREKRERRAARNSPFKNRVGRDRRDKHQQILNPLVAAHGPQGVSQTRERWRKDLRHSRGTAGRTFHPPRSVYQDRVPAALPDHQIRA